MCGPWESSDSSREYKDQPCSQSGGPCEEAFAGAATFNVDLLLLCVAEEQTLTAKYGRQPAWGIPFGGALCVKFIQMCSIVGEQIMDR